LNNYSFPLKNLMYVNVKYSCSKDVLCVEI